MITSDTLGVSYVIIRFGGIWQVGTLSGWRPVRLRPS
jgi:hypothetical protein